MPSTLIAGPQFFLCAFLVAVGLSGEMRRLVGNDYPLEVFPNWNLLSKDKYYVAAPVDKLLGDWGYSLRAHLTSLILAGNPATIFLQSFRSPLLTKIAFIFSWLGLEEFFFSLIVSLLWLFDARLGRLLSILLSIGFFVSGILKVSLCLPRPPCPPAIRISDEDRDWAWPSNHALLGTVFPWFIWMYSCKHYHELSLASSFLLLLTVLLWNCGVSWSRIYLGVHSPCDVLSGWTIGVLILFVFSGFSDRFYDVFVEACRSGSSSYFFVYLYSLALFLLYIHPRAWPETQSYMEVVSIISGTAAIWCGNVFNLNGENAPSISLLEQNAQAGVLQLLARFFAGVVFVLAVRLIVKAVSKLLFHGLYSYLGMNYYSYSEMCRHLGEHQPTKRYTPRMRFKLIPGTKVILPEEAPYDIDLPIKFVVYSAVGFTVGVLCPVLFSHMGI